MANRMGLRTLDALSLGSAIGGSNLRRTATPVVERRPRDRGTGAWSAKSSVPTAATPRRRPVGAARRRSAGRSRAPGLAVKLRSMELIARACSKITVSG